MFCSVCFYVFLSHKCLKRPLLTKLKSLSTPYPFLHVAPILSCGDDETSTIIFPVVCFYKKNLKKNNLILGKNYNEIMLVRSYPNMYLHEVLTFIFERIWIFNLTSNKNCPGITTPGASRTKSSIFSLFNRLRSTFLSIELSFNPL